MRLQVFAGVLLALIAGCADTSWTKKGAGEAELVGDRSQCKEQAYEAAPVRLAPAPQAYVPPVTLECHTAGVGGVPTCSTVQTMAPLPTGDANELPRLRLFERCMRERGWEHGPDGG